MEEVDYYFTTMVTVIEVELNNLMKLMEHILMNLLKLVNMMIVVAEMDVEVEVEAAMEEAMEAETVVVEMVMMNLVVLEKDIAVVKMINHIKQML